MFINIRHVKHPISLFFNQLNYQIYFKDLHYFTSISLSINSYNSSKSSQIIELHLICPIEITNIEKLNCYIIPVTDHNIYFNLPHTLVLMLPFFYYYYFGTIICILNFPSQMRKKDIETILPLELLNTMEKK